jgi:hypothetical protein
MKTTLFLLLFCVSLNFNSFAQVFGNEWIQYSQKYYAFKIHTSGIHKIDYSALQNANITSNAFSTQNIQIFGREQEIPLYIEDGGDSSFDPGDYLMFYAEKNDGWLDSTLYESASDVGNPKYSLYNDTIQYFFTWNTATNNKRFQLETDTDIAAYAPSNYILFERFQSNNSSYNEGEKYSDASSSFYTSGEGWGSSQVNGAGGYTWDASTTQIDQIYQGPDAPLVQYKSVTVGVSNASFSGVGNHHTKHTIGTSNFAICDSIFTGWKAIHISKTFPVSILPASGNSNFKISIVGDQGAATDYQSINYWSFLYPRIPNLSGAASSNFLVENNEIQSKIRVDLTNISSSNPLFFVLGENPKKLAPISNGGMHSLLIPNSISGTKQRVIQQDATSILTISNLVSVGPGDRFTDFESMETDSSLLMIYHPKLQASSAQYADYRSSDLGGNHTVIFANVNELYQQYGGGIEKHINGIRRFSHHIYENATVKPVGLFLIGKGIREANVVSILSTGPGSRKNSTNFAASLIPSFGQPSSDACITSNLIGTTKWKPLIATGRIAVNSNQELSDYLDKVKEHEQNQNPLSEYSSSTKDWQKQVLHFIGGSNVGQQNLFGQYMGALANILKKEKFGGNVQSIAKIGNNPLSPTELNAVMDRIRDGVSLINLFGHYNSSSSGFEINIDEPSNWNNQGKYPLIITNSCYNGDIFQNSVSKSEEFVRSINSGAIGYIGTIGLGFPHTLNQYSSQLYKQFSGVNYGTTLGKQIQETIATLESPSADLFIESTCLQMTLNGDPMVKLNWHERPEIEITEQSISFLPQDLNLTIDSIQINLDLKNLGRSITDTFLVEVTRNFPSTAVDSVYTFLIPELHYTSTLSFKLPLQANIGIGINTFSFKIDQPSYLDEQYDEVLNNQVVKTLFIDIDGIQPILPYEFAVVPNDSVTLKASTINPIAELNTYRFEIDTIDFEGAASPFHRFALITGLGGIKEINPSQWILSSSMVNVPLICTDSTVYFWRVAVDDPNPLWRESSFQYIPNKTGWGQDHFFQFKKNNFNGVEYNRANRKRFFGPNSAELTCDVKASTANEGIFNEYSINGQQKEYGLCFYTPSFYVAVIDPLSFQPWQTEVNAVVYGEELCRGRAENYFVFRQGSPDGRLNFQNMLATVPDSHFILVYSPMTTLYSSWDLQTFATFQNLGSDSIVPGRPNLPFAFFCKKGNPNSVIEVFSQYYGQDIQLTAELIGSDYIGSESSELIGPAGDWQSLFWKQDPLNNPNEDSTVLYVKAYNSEGIYQTSDTLTFTLNDSIIDLSAYVNASDYPFIQLSAFYIDSVGFSPAQIDRWHVLYTPLPEVAIDGSSGYSWLPNSDTLTEGETVQFAVDIKNIFTLPMDSLLVNYWIQDDNQQKHPISYSRQDSLLVGEIFRDTITFSTIGLLGLNSFWMEVNPYVNGSLFVTDQPEQKHFNNLLQIPFYVSGDDQHPVLDVTFNGRHILNGDIVSPESEILISLKDENELLLMNAISDTALFGVYLTDPDGKQRRIPFMDADGNTVMQWIPAESQSKRFKILYPAYFAKDGKYSISVQGSDRSGNESGDLEYRITFEVIHESAITQMVNYPNPFSTSTRFVFTLTGLEAPDEIIIQIMTVSGRVVREITEDELGTIQIGRNISEYAWDGKDEFGDPLANGVYLYTVKAQINGEKIKHLESGADAHFKKEFGKMYLIR